jgi:hypothetical protein
MLQKVWTLFIDQAVSFSIFCSQSNPFGFISSLYSSPGIILYLPTFHVIKTFLYRNFNNLWILILAILFFSRFKWSWIILFLRSWIQDTFLSLTFHFECR